MRLFTETEPKTSKLFGISVRQYVKSRMMKFFNISFDKYRDAAKCEHLEMDSEFLSLALVEPDLNDRIHADMETRRDSLPLRRSHLTYICCTYTTTNFFYVDLPQLT